MAAVDISTFLVRGGQYTISLKSNGLYRPLLDTVTSELQFVPSISGIQVKLVGGIYGFFADQFDITFTYTGDGSDVAANVAGNMINAMSVNLASFELVGVSIGPAGIPTEGTSAGGGAQLPSIDKTTVALIVVGIGLIVFLASGGATVTRRLAGA